MTIARKHLFKSLNFSTEVRKMVAGNLNTSRNQKENSKHEIPCRSNNFNDKNHVRVGIIGGGLSPIYSSILLKQCRLIKSIHLVDTKETLKGAAFDAGHIDTSTKIKYYNVNQIKEALENVDVIALLDESDYRLGNLGPHEQFAATLKYICKIAALLARIRPEALLAIFARPVTTALPFVSEIYKCAGCYKPERIIGSTAVETMRIETLTANLLGLDPGFFQIPIAAGADACTVVPLLSRAKPFNQFSNEQEQILLQSLRSADNELTRSSVSKGTIFSTAAAVAKLILTLVSGMNGCENAVSNAYVRSDVLPICQYFTSEVQFGPNGVERNAGLPKVSRREEVLIGESISIIRESIDLALKAFKCVDKAKLKPRQRHKTCEEDTKEYRK